uniref:Uncharacterized protein LOC111128129 n=1 Tax=Crassostrea virginica TaxID=6565 RepID=A0A8B8DP00_CRAVI|nr:uncharacterized protein LOC111128129 [Crassostrea virginica]
MTSSSMTVNGCRKRCQRENTKYFGVENGNQCFCGSVMRFKIRKPKKDCKRKCRGSGEACGGPWRILVYRNLFYRRCSFVPWKRFKISKATTCEWQGLTLRCGRGRVIRVVYAIYGRRNRHVCAKNKSIKTTNCRARNSKKIAVKTCMENAPVD